MKNSLRLLAALSALSMFISLPSCKKVTDYLHDHPTGEMRNYRITKFIANWDGESYPQFDTLTISYNSYGDPISARRSFVGTGSPNWLFFYDSKHRLTDLVGLYGDTIEEQNVESWNRYFYDNADRVILDSNYFYPWVDNGNPWRGFFGNIGTTYFSYDSYGRISQTKYYDEDLGPQITSYSYNADGNLNGYTYDNKTNFRRLNKVWLFLGRDYSVNNRAVGTFTYNPAGLPTSIAATSDQGGQWFMFVPSDGVGFRNATIEYAGH